MNQSVFKAYGSSTAVIVLHDGGLQGLNQTFTDLGTILSSDDGTPPT